MPFEELKERNAAMWGAGPFEQIADALVDMHDSLIAAVAAKPGDTWLDVVCGERASGVHRALRTGR